MPQTSQVTVTTAATLLRRADSDGIAILIRNDGAVDMFVGGSGVTATNGLRVKAGESISLPLDPNDPIHAIVASGSTTVHTLSTRV